MRAKHRAIDATIGGNLRYIRMQAGFSQEALANRLGITFQQIQKYERGTNRIASSTLYQLSEELDAPLMAFFKGLIGEAKISASPCDKGNSRLHIETSSLLAIVKKD